MTTERTYSRPAFIDVVIPSPVDNGTEGPFVVEDETFRHLATIYPDRRADGRWVVRIPRKAIES